MIQWLRRRLEDLETLDIIFFGAVIIVGIGLLVGIPMLIANKNERWAREEASCESHGMEIMYLVQGGGKSTYNKYVCRAPNGQLYAF